MKKETLRTILSFVLLFCMVMAFGKNVFAGDRTTSIRLDGWGSVETGSYENFEGYYVYYENNTGWTTCTVYYKGPNGTTYASVKQKTFFANWKTWEYEFYPDYGSRAYVKLSNHQINGSDAYVYFKAYGSW